MSVNTKVKSSGGLFTTLLGLAIIGGWIANIVKLIGMGFSGPATAELVLRVAGIPVAPLGVVMGFV